ncbi:MAG: MFS transporter, partial [Armatimonadetes bacterium]|nr:MFS transporter [Armatimonadota bacterium]
MTARDWLEEIGKAILLTVVVFTYLAVVTAMLGVYLERKISGWIQARLGPKHVGPQGLLQTIADTVKLLQKEHITPRQADVLIFNAAPVLVAVAGLLDWVVIPFGRLGDMLGHKRVYNVGFIIMIVAATLSSMAQNEWWLMASRALQGLGGAVIMSNSPAILTSAFPTNQRGQALGMQGTMTYLGLTVGPSLGGYVADNLGWRWAFFIDVPIGIIATMLAFLVIPSLNLPRKREKFDPAGA